MIRSPSTSAFLFASKAFLAGCLLFALFLPADGNAQSMRLDRTEGFANDGRVAEAREMLEEWWEQERSGASRTDLQRALWLRGILTLDPEVAQTDYQRLVLEFPGGPFSDRALQRLAQGAHVDDDLAGATRHYRRLLRDYPDSPLRAEAEEWLAQFAEEGAAPAAGRSTATAPAGERDTPPAAQRTPPSGSDAPASSPPGGDTGDVGQPLAIQLGAFQSEEGARRLIESTAAAGIGVRLVRTPGSDLVRVRTGHFATREELEPVLARIRALGFDGFLVADGESEVPL